MTVGGGDNELNFQRLHGAWVDPIKGNAPWKVGYEAEYSHSESDGTVAYSDHDFERLTRIQWIGPNSQSDIFAGYQSKFFGQFGMYTGDQYTAFDPLKLETIKTRLFLLNHQQAYGIGSSWQATAYYRRNSDHYIFNRFAPNNTFIHETKVYSIGFSGRHAYDQAFALNHSFQFTRDAIESNTLEAGKFTNRSYYKLSLVPEYRYALKAQHDLRFKVGLSFDDTNRNTSRFLLSRSSVYSRIKVMGVRNVSTFPMRKQRKLRAMVRLGAVKAAGFFGATMISSASTRRIWNSDTVWIDRNGVWRLRFSIAGMTTWLTGPIPERAHAQLRMSRSKPLVLK